MTITLRAFHPDDLPVLQAVRQAAFAPVFQSFRDLVGDSIYAIALADSDADQAKLLVDICAGAPDRVLVAEQAGAIIGFVSYTLDDAKKVGEITLNAVHPDAAGQGVGALMYAHVLDLMRAAGMKVATVGTGGDASHEPARRAYEKCGFTRGVPSVWLVRSLD